MAVGACLNARPIQSLFPLLPLSPFLAPLRASLRPVPPFCSPRSVPFVLVPPVLPLPSCANVAQATQSSNLESRFTKNLVLVVPTKLVAERLANARRSTSFVFIS